VEQKEEFVLQNVSWMSFFFFFLFFFSELGTEPRALRLLGKCSTTELNPQPLDVLKQFATTKRQIESSFQILFGKTV